LYVPLRNSSSHPLEHKVLRTRNFTQRQVLRWRTNEDQVIVLGVDQRKKTAALNTQILVEQIEDFIKSMHRQNFSHARVVIEDVRSGVLRGVVITHSTVRTPHESRIAEDDPGLLRAREKPLPENAQRRRNLCALACRV